MMTNKHIRKQRNKIGRAQRTRKKLHGTTTRPRLSVNKSNKHIQAQLIDDSQGKTLAMLGTFSAEFRGTDFMKKNKASARKIGARIAEIAKEHSIKEIIFDRGSFKYHGILAELADGAREGGLQF